LESLGYGNENLAAKFFSGNVSFDLRSDFGV